MGGGSSIGGQTSDGPDSFTLSTMGVPYVPSESEYTPGLTTYLLHLGPANTHVVAVMGGDVIETGVAGLLEVRLSECEMVSDTEEECLIQVVQFGGSPSGPDADGRMTGYSFRSDFEGIATRSEDGWSATLYPEEIMLDMNKIISEEETSYHGVYAQEVSFDCTPEACNVEAYAM